jgi:thiamine transport system ATP-binding protein
MLECEHVTVRFDGRAVVDDVTLSVAAGEVVAVLGPSGSGKSTLLRVIAGLQPPDDGTIRWRGRDVTHLPAHERRFGLMFQDYALFPHRSVAGNVAFGLEMQGLGPAESASIVEQLLALVGLAGMGGRKVAELSGGEQQRVALARTLAPSPQLVMLDEPIGALDRTLRDELTAEMARIFGTLEAAVLYVTHDQGEAFALAQRVVVMRDGAVVGQGGPDELWRRPPSEFVARFLGMGAACDADIAGGVADVGWAHLPADGAPDGPARVVIRPDGAALDEAGSIRGVVAGSTYSEGRYSLGVEVSPGVVLHATSSRPVATGTAVRVSVARDAVVVLRDGGHSVSSDV